jgi:hypothetical protein
MFPRQQSNHHEARTMDSNQNRNQLYEIESADYNRLSTIYNMLSVDYDPNHPIMTALRVEIESKVDRLTSMIAGMIAVK